MTLVAKEQDVLERRMHERNWRVEEIDLELKAEGYTEKAYDIEQAALIAHVNAPEDSVCAYKGAIQQCVLLGKNPTHSKKPMKVVCISDMRNKGLCSRFRKTASQQKMYKDAWEEAGQTVVSPKSKQKLLPKKTLHWGRETE
jgi:hypothetical protein